MRHLIEEKESVKIVRIQEDLGSKSTRPFRHLVEQVASKGFERILFDFSGVRFVASMSITSLFSAYKKLKDGGGELGLVGVSPELAKIFEVVGLPALVKSFPTEREALDYFKEKEG
ncbi:MAG: STAS domain-containing protein [Candidatus Wallbacteria bacterium]|nr:STAS domain-containing protein [Candidatus Wallbacteria bacterium]